MRFLRPLAALFLAVPTLFLVACGEPPVEERLTGVQEMLRESRFRDAISELRDVLDTHPDHARANFLLAVGFIRTNQGTLAVWPLEKAFADPEFRVRAGLQLGNLHLALNNPTDAASVATRLLEAAPENAEAHRIRARAYLADKRFDEAIRDAEWLIETDSAEPMGLVLKGSILSDLERYEEAEKLFREAIALTAEEPADNERAWVVLASFLAKNVADAARAEAAFDEARTLHPDSPALRGGYLTFLTDNERLGDAEQLLRDEIEREPENFQLRITLANNLRAQERDDEANAALEQLTEDFPIAASWQVLGRARLEAEDFAGATDALGKAVELAPQDEALRFLLAEAQVRGGDLDAARELVKSFEGKPYRHFVHGLIALESGRFAEALERFESGLRNWPDNVGARYNAGVAAQGLGDWERAIHEFTEAARLEMSSTRNTTDPFQTQAAMQLARIYQRRGDHRSALYWARIQLLHHSGAHDVRLLIANTLREQGSLEQARAEYEALLDTPVAAEARAELASLEFEAGDAPKAWKVLAEAESGNLRALSVAAEHEVADGKLASAIRRLDEAQASGDYEAAELLSLRGRVLHTGGRTGEAEAAFRQVLELDPENAGALAALATIRASAGAIDEAVASFDRAAELEPQNPDHPYHAGQLLLQLGRSAEAEQRLRAAGRIDPGHAESRNDLAWLLSGDASRLDEAFRIASEAYRLNDASVFADTLGWTHYLRGEFPLAVDLLTRAARDDPDDPTIRYHLGMALVRHGQGARALEELKAAVDSGGFTELESARLEIARLEGVGS